MIRTMVVVALMLSSVAAKAVQYKVVDGSVVQLIGHITGGSFTASNHKVSGTITTDATGKVTNGTVVIKADGFETGIGMRDRHMREKYLQADKYPLITLDVTGAQLPERGVGEFDIDGTFECHGVKKPAKLHLKVTDAGDGVLKATSAFLVDITNYGIEQPKFAVVKMEPKVDVSVEIRFGDK
jgi:polyisoprenoid-binding protein YceI